MNWTSQGNPWINVVQLKGSRASSNQLFIGTIGHLWPRLLPPPLPQTPRLSVITFSLFSPFCFARGESCLLWFLFHYCCTIESDAARSYERHQRPLITRRTANQTADGSEDDLCLCSGCIEPSDHGDAGNGRWPPKPRSGRRHVRFLKRGL